MATYRTKFQLTFDDVKGNARTVEILKKNYFGQIYDMTGTGEPVIIKWENDDDFYNSIIGSSCELNILVTENDNYDDFMNFDEREFKVRVSSGAADSGDEADIVWNQEETLFNEANNIWSSSGDVDIYWEGFLVADTYREQFVSLPYVLSLRAIDGLGTLDAFDAPDGAIALDANDNPQTSDNSQSNFDTAFSYVYKILQNLDLNFDISIQNKIRERQGSETLTLFHDIYLNEFSLMDNFAKRNAKEVLDNILRITNSRIYQSNGSWYITSNSNVYDERVVPSVQTTQLPFVPTVTTNIATSITNTSMTLNGEVTDNFGLAIIERGFYFGPSTNYLNNTKTAEGGTTVSAFTANKTSLIAGTTYYVTAYATNSAGEGIGATLSAITTGTTPTVQPTFNCLIAGLNINNGTVGDTVTGTVVYGTISSISPSTYQSGNTVYTATITVPAGYTNTGSTINCTDSATGSLPTFTCSDANVFVPNGITGQTVTATLDEGTVISITPSTYQSGTNTYTVRVNVPSGYSNTGSSINCTDSAIGDTALPTYNCTTASLSIPDGYIGATVTGTVSEGTITSISPSTYSSGSQTYTATITVPSGYTNSGSSVNCTDTATGTTPPAFTCSDANLSIPDGVVGETVTGTVSEGTITSISPSTYQSGTQTYTATITVPAGYSGTTINCTDTATGNTSFTCSDATLTINDGYIGETVTANVNEGAITNITPSTYQSGVYTYTATITAPSGYTNAGSSISCDADGTGTNPPIDPPVFDNTATLTTSVTNVSMTLNAEITSNGGATLTEKGFYFGTTSALTSGNKNVVSGTTIGAYTLAKSSLTQGTLYYFTPFAANGTITTYGTTKSVYTHNAMRVRRVSDNTIFNAQYNASFSVGDAITLSTTGTVCYVIIEETYLSNAATFPTIVGVCATTILPPTTPAPLNEFTCSDANLSISDGTIGATVSGTVSLGTIASYSPDTYIAGTQTYTAVINIPQGYSNSGNISCTDTATGEYQGSNIYIVSRLSDGFERQCQYNGSFAINTNVELSDDSVNCYKIREEGVVGDNTSLPTITQACTITTTTSNVTTTPTLTHFMNYRDCATGGLDQLISVGNTNSTFPEIIKNSSGECFFKYQTTPDVSSEWVDRDYTSNFVDCNDCQGITTTQSPNVAPSFTSQPVITNVTADSMLISAEVSNFSQLNVTYKVHIGFSPTYTNNTSHLISTNSNSVYSISYNAQNLQPDNTYYVTIVAQTTEFADVVSNTVSTTTDPAIFYKIYTQCNEGAGAVKYVSNQTSTFPNVIYDGTLCYELYGNGGVGQDGDVDSFTSFTDCTTCEGQTTTTLAPTTTLPPCVAFQAFTSTVDATDACCVATRVKTIYANNSNMDNATIVYLDSACTQTLVPGSYFTLNGNDYYFWNGITLTKSICPACP